MKSAKRGKHAKISRKVSKTRVSKKRKKSLSTGAKYEEALIGQLHLIPNLVRLDALKKDYEKMNPMFFAKPPEFDDIIKLLSNLEKEINSKVS